MLASTNCIFMLIKQNVSRHIRVFWSVCHVETRKLLCVTPVTPAQIPAYKIRVTSKIPIRFLLSARFLHCE